MLVFGRQLVQLHGEGVSIKTLTASLASNNHTPAIRDQVDLASVHSGFVYLHVKAMVGDRRRCFIGSLNLDPRALEINTENSLSIESPGLAASFDPMMQPQNAWRVYLYEERQTLVWRLDQGSTDTQPARGFRQPLADRFFRLLPIEHQL